MIPPTSIHCPSATEGLGPFKNKDSKAQGCGCTLLLFTTGSARAIDVQVGPARWQAARRLLPIAKKERGVAQELEAAAEHQLGSAVTVVHIGDRSPSTVLRHALA
jgi:hypothetical protein